MGILFGLLAGLRAFLYASKLVRPVTFERASPFMERPNCLGVGAIEHLAAVAADVHQADFEEHTEVLGDRGLREIKSGDDVVYGALLGYEEAENVAAARFGHGIEGVGGGGGARHGRIIFLYGNMSRVILVWRNSGDSGD
jgi:hypothetical protein